MYFIISHTLKSQSAQRSHQLSGGPSGGRVHIQCMMRQNRVQTLVEKLSLHQNPLSTTTDVRGRDGEKLLQWIKVLLFFWVSASRTNLSTDSAAHTTQSGKDVVAGSVPAMNPCLSVSHDVHSAVLYSHMHTSVMKSSGVLTL